MQFHEVKDFLFMSTVDPVFLVDPYSEPIILKINGRATYLNCGPLAELFKQLLLRGRKDFIIDFQRCTGMDSTFLGLIAGLAIDVSEQKHQGHLTLCRLSDRNLELVRNLGLHRIAAVEANNFPMHFSDDKARPLSAEKGEQVTNAQTILKAHENLVYIDQENLKKFQDVIQYLKNQIENGGNHSV